MRVRLTGKIRLAVCIGIVSIWILSVVAPTHAQEQPGPVHGTVNVFLATKDTLVAVTDSMLTGPAGHSPTGFKLYAIDDHTICTMAGLYRIHGANFLDSFAVFMPKIIGDFIAIQKRSGGSSAPFAIRVNDLLSTVRFELTAHLHALSAAQASLNVDDPSLIVELTMAGYDLDGKLKIADITLEPARTQRGAEFISVDRPFAVHAAPACEFSAKFEQLHPSDLEHEQFGAGIHVVSDSLYCEIPGLADVGEKPLADPDATSTSLALRAYVKAEEQSSPLSTDDLKALALYIVDQTTDNEQKTRQFRVGGPPEIAIMTGGKLVEHPPDIPTSQAGEFLLNSVRTQVKYTCKGDETVLATSVSPHMGSRVLYYFGKPTADAQVDITNCIQPLDGVIFHDSTFTDGVLTYDGSGILLFASDNKVLRTTLKLGAKVDEREKSVQKLICGFPWKAVYHESTELKRSCGTGSGNTSGGLH